MAIPIIRELMKKVAKDGPYGHLFPWWLYVLVPVLLLVEVDK